MLALQEAEIEKVAVVIDSRNDNVHHTKPVDMMKLKGQRFNEFRKGTGFYLHDMLPLSERYAAVAKECFTQESDSGIRYSDRDQAPAYEEWEVQTALYDALDHKDVKDDNLIKVSKMPKYVTEKLGIEGDFYIYRNHAYDNMVSKKQAIEEGRYKEKGHYHNFGIEKMTEAIMSLEDPVLTVMTKTPDGNPTVIMALPVLGDNGAPLNAILSFYADRPINGSHMVKPHIVLTISPRNYEDRGKYKGWNSIINEAIKEGKLLDYNKKRGDLLVTAQQTRLGSVTAPTLNANLAQFVKEVNTFREKNKISYQDRLPMEDRNRLSVLGGKKATAGCL